MYENCIIDSILVDMMFVNFQSLVINS